MKKRVSLILILLFSCFLLAACSGGNATRASFFTFIVDVDNHVTITGYTGNEANVNIPSRIDGKPVTKIAAAAFEENTLIGNVVIPDTVTELGDGVFRHCTALQSVVLPKSLTEIPYMAFCGCDALHTITIPESVAYIGDKAFLSCNSLYELHLPKKLTWIGASAFAWSGIKEITIPGGVRRSSMNNEEDGWFRGCSKLKSVSFESGITAVYLADFNGNAEKYDKRIDLLSLDRLTIPDTVTTFYDYTGNKIDNDSSFDAVCGLFNCEIKKVIVKKGSVADSFFLKAKTASKFVTYRINKRLAYLMKDKEGYTLDYYSSKWDKTDQGYFKETPFEGTIAYE